MSQSTLDNQNENQLKTQLTPCVIVEEFTSSNQVTKRIIKLHKSKFCKTREWKSIGRAWSCDGWSTPNPTSPSQRSPCGSNSHEATELEIFIIDEHFPRHVVGPASGKLQVCCSELSSWVTDVVPPFEVQQCAVAERTQHLTLVFLFWSIVWTAGLLSCVIRIKYMI